MLKYKEIDNGIHITETQIVCFLITSLTFSVLFYNPIKYLMEFNNFVPFGMSNFSAIFFIIIFIVGLIKMWIVLSDLVSHLMRKNESTKKIEIAFSSKEYDELEKKNLVYIKSIKEKIINEEETNKEIEKYIKKRVI